MKRYQWPKKKGNSEMSEETANQTATEPIAETTEAGPEATVSPTSAETALTSADISAGEAPPWVENQYERVTEPLSKLLAERKAASIPDAAPSEDDAAKVERLGLLLPDIAFENAIVSLTEDGRVECSIKSFGEDPDELVIRVSHAKAARFIAGMI
jgi:hypothetical protein